MAAVGIFIRIPAGALSTSIGRVRFLIPGHAILVLAPLLPILFPNSIAALYGLSLLYGAVAVTMPTALALVHDSVRPEDRGRAVGYYTSVTALGHTLGPILAGEIVASTDQFPYAFAAASAIALVSLTLTLCIREPRRLSDGSPWTRTLSDLREVIAEPRLRNASIARSVQTISMGVMNAFFPLYAKEIASLSTQQIGYLTAASSLTAVVSKPVVAALSAQAGRLPFMTAGMLACSFGLAVIPFVTSFPALFAVCIFMGMSHSLNQISTISYIADVAGIRLFGAAAGIVGSFFELGLVAGRVGAGPLISTFGYTVGFAVPGAVILAVSGPLLLRLRGASSLYTSRTTSVQDV
jgi:MFS family permease